MLCAFRRALNHTAFRLYVAALQQLAHDLDALREADVTQHMLVNLSPDHRGQGRVQLEGLKAKFAQSRTREVGDLRSAMGTEGWSARRVKLRDAASSRTLVIETQESMSSMTRRVARVTSGPMPSPGINTIVCFAMMRMIRATADERPLIGHRRHRL